MVRTPAAVAHPRTEVMAVTVERHLVADPIPAGRRPALRAAAVIADRLRAADRAEEIPADPMAARPAVDIAITNKFPPRFTPHLTHRQEAPQGASCSSRAPGRKSTRGTRNRMVAPSPRRTSWQPYSFIPRVRLPIWE